MLDGISAISDLFVTEQREYSDPAVRICSESLSQVVLGITTFSVLAAPRIRHGIIVREFKEFRTDFSMAVICDAQATVPLWIGERLFVRLVNVKDCCE